MRCVDRSVWQPAESFQQVFTLERGRLSQRLALDHLCKARACGNGSHAAARAIAHLVDASIGKLDRKAHDIATHRMLQSHLGVRRRQLADVARMLEMVEDGAGVGHYFCRWLSVYIIQ